MPVIIQTGKLSGVVTPLKGQPFNVFWSQLAIAPGALVPVFSQTNSEALTRWVSKIYVSAQVRCDIELRVDSTVVWSGGTTVMNLHPPPWDFSDAEIPWLAGKILQVFVRHTYTGLPDFAGNIAGFTR